MFISAGIEISDYDKALELISKELDDMKKGNITSEELTNSRKFIINNLKSLNDNLSALTDYYYSMSIQDSNRTIDDVISLVSKVEISDIVEVGKEIYLDTVYFLTGKSNN
jgi:predicted Zn-dependent peptidase